MLKVPYLFFLFIIFQYSNYQLYSFDKFTNSCYEMIESFVAQYKRPITVLEVAQDHIKYTHKLVDDNLNVSACAICFSSKARQLNGQNNTARLSICGPRFNLGYVLECLSKCEHFDIIIIHDCLKSLFHKDFNAVKYLFKLGDNLFLEIENSYLKSLSYYSNYKVCYNFSISKNKHKSLICFHCPKSSLDWARWTQQYYPPKNINKYIIKSNFNTKLFIKPEINKPIIWTPGINLVTFVMLSGVYPSSKEIIKQLKQIHFTYPNHNDFVIGNLILNGAKLTPIDFNDKRRNSESSYCLQQAIALFSNPLRVNDPEKAIYQYYKNLDKK